MDFTYSDNVEPVAPDNMAGLAELAEQIAQWCDLHVVTLDELVERVTREADEERWARTRDVLAEAFGDEPGAVA